LSKNNVLLAKDSFPPYIYIWKATSVGKNVLVARIEANGTIVASDSVSVSVRDAFIAISSPYNGEQFSPGDTVMIVAEPLGTSGHTVASVDFYRNNLLLGSKSKAPFMYTWKNAAKGNYDLKVVAHDTKGKLDSAKVSVTVANMPPRIYIYNPTDGTVFYKGNSVTIMAWASDSNGYVSRVIFYKNGKQIGTVSKPSDTTNNFRFSFYDTTVGTFTLSAKAIDNKNDTGISNSVTITRRDDFIILTTPRDSQVFQTGSNITLAASTMEAKFHTVKNVKFYRNNKLLTTITTSPFQYAWQNAATGTYQIMAVALDTKGKMDSTKAVTIIVKNIPPQIYLYAYGASGGQGNTVSQKDSLVLYPYVNDSTGVPVTSVKYYENGKLIATKTAYPYVYTFALKNTPVGSYSFYAIATNSKGLTGKSNTDTISVVSKIPHVSLNSPINGAMVNQYDSIKLSATLTDFDSVSSVQFIVDSQMVVATVHSIPYSASVTGLQVGFHIVRANVITKTGQMFSSDGVYFSVTGPQQQMPDIAITSPLDSSIFTSTQSIAIQAVVNDTNHVISRVNFYSDSMFLGTDSIAPYSYKWSKPSLGAHWLRAEETAYTGDTKSSRSVEILVR